MVRFNFVLDSKLNVYLMEVNMSPNLCTKHFSGNRLLYEQVIYNFLRLVGSIELDFKPGRLVLENYISLVGTGDDFLKNVLYSDLETC